MAFDSILTSIFALILVLALIGVLALLGRRFGLLAAARPARGGGRRLGITEVAPVDAKRRLILVRRDQTEHLVLLGGESDLVIERNIPATESSNSQPTEPTTTRSTA
ncbi:MAG TPA: flagellar biosynthetic protein FliO [Alphaproteobacteria bacterium]|jgi:flagellar protein FliO/FliZ|nr:flagellar biosynthetic protein FliO [Alphaproteobacteria bacterium]|tara:strand:+ start:1568 stop:1888 length:321 start_codon:yes stop_codon:yes gene_type:complete